MLDKINDVEILIQKMMNFYTVFTMKELSEKIGISQQAISKWKNNNSIVAIKKKCRELGIYNEIFGDLKLSTNEEESNQELNNDVFSDDILKTLDIIRTMVKNNQDLDNKLNETLKSFIKENL